MTPVHCTNCDTILGYTYATQGVPRIWCSLPCTDYVSESPERDDLIVVMGRDLHYTPTQIMVRLENERGLVLSRQHIHKILKHAGVVAA